LAEAVTREKRGGQIQKKQRPIQGIKETFGSTVKKKTDLYTGGPRKSGQAGKRNQR